MGSNALPQALYVIPRNPVQCGPKKLGFLAMVSKRPLTFNSSAMSISRILPNSLGFNFGKVYDRRGFVVRAEENSEAAETGNAENDEAIAESEAPDTETETVEAESEEEAEIKSEAVETEERPPRKPRIKLGDIMGILNKRAIEASDKERPTPDIRTGDVVEIKLEVPENKRRMSIYKGIVISKQNAGIHTTIRIRRIIAGIGVEIVFPIYSPNIKEIKVLSHRKVRRARLYYLREKLPRLSTFK